ncbi:hypothetical protein GCM10008090_14830 [Arenicella chitinivorans]|uniref:Uncharacterized protein n=1 Tax=Arenicella chitinivorans TaxID=1329800 RepID=A0A918VLI5_9GAMM|nr:hypothetical protein GCM10008090_14830 [Arenicella chitinivorans]
MNRSAKVDVEVESVVLEDSAVANSAASSCMTTALAVIVIRVNDAPQSVPRRALFLIFMIFVS